MNRDLLLKTNTAKALYHDYAAPMPIIDYHCHVSPRDIAEDRRYENIAQLWLEGDHYKWRLMRWCGVDEAYITGSAAEKEKFIAFAAVLPKAVGNPVYHWTHLELQRYFDCDIPLNSETAEEIWHHCNAKLHGGLSVRRIIQKSNVKVICTTDDPVDDLKWHRAIAQDAAFATKVLPTFRPDGALNIHRPGFEGYIQKLEEAGGNEVHSFEDLCQALSERLDYFVQQGCRFADHGLDEIPWNPDAGDVERIFRQARKGEKVGKREAEAYQTALLLFLGGAYARRGLVMQLHYGAQRNVNPTAFAQLGADTGFDCIATPNCSGRLAALLGALENKKALPKTILYSLNPGDNAMLASLAGSFQGGGIPGRVQQGAAWWFNDTKQGIQQQLASLAGMGVLGCFVGMLTDSRSFTSYTRHEVFRRVLCDMVGAWMESGEYPNDIKQASRLVQDISYNNIARYMGLEEAE